MAKFEIKLPKMGESVAEATIISWLKNVGDHIEMDEAIVEIATDKVDSEVPSDVEGTLVELLYDVDAVVKVGETIAIIEKEDENVEQKAEVAPAEEVTHETATIEKEVEKAIEATTIGKVSDSGKFLSPLVRNIASTEGVSMEELEAIIGTGKDDRVTKNDILAYIESGRNADKPVKEEIIDQVKQPKTAPAETVKTAMPISVSGEDEIIEMS